MDVLDYRFYQNNEKLTVSFINSKGKVKNKRIKKAEYDELGLGFATYLMDKQHSCLNKCIFCFIDQLPCGMRESLYFKDDDTRLSFLHGNYITMTDISDKDVFPGS
jgi:NifB/MoaA-like Fe-S oxidoreductase